MRKVKIQVLYEHGFDFRPYSSSYIRLLRPLTHPGITGNYEVAITPVLLDQPTDLVLVDRLWNRVDASLKRAEILINSIHELNAKFVYFTDDDLSSNEVLTKGYSKDDIEIFHYFLDNANLIVVTTEYLKEKLSGYRSPIIIIPNYIDERLIIRHIVNRETKNKKIVGYMGTATHNEDLEIIVPALIEFQQRHRDVLYEFVGVHNNVGFQNIPSINDLVYRIVSPPVYASEYPLFYLWWTSSIYWDFAIAPLRNIDFNLFKSNIKFLDYAAIGVPGIFSNLDVYQKTVSGRGLLTRNTNDCWLSALQSFHDDEELRSTLRKEAGKYLFSEGTLLRGISDYNNLTQYL